MVTVATARTDANGTYALRAVPTPQIAAEAARNDGWVNYWLMTSTGTKQTIEGVSRHWDGTGWTQFDKTTGRVGMSPGDPHQVAFTTDAKTGKPANFAVGAAGANPNGFVPPAGCHPWVDSYTNNWTAVMEFHNSADADSSYSYGQTADSDIGVGLEYTYGGWSVGSTAHIGNSGGSTFYENISANFGKYIASLFQYELGHWVDSISGSCNFDGLAYVRPSAWLGGLQYMVDVSQYNCLQAPQSSYITTLTVNQGMDRVSNRAYTFPLAATIPVPFHGSVGLTATSGHSSQVQMHWKAVRNWIYLCGNNTYPASSKIVYAY